MNKKVVIIVVAVILLLGVGGFFMLGNKNSGNPAAQGNPITSMKDALTKAVSMQCDYTDQEGRVSKTYIKNGAVRSDYTGKTDADSGSVIVTKEKMYMWTADKKGFSYDIPQVTGTPDKTQSNAGEAGQSVNKKDSFMADLDKYKQSCKPAIVSDSLFTPPSDVTFTDYSQMMMQMQRPHTGAGGAPGGMTQEQMKAYQQQYMPTGQPNQNNPY